MPRVLPDPELLEQLRNHGAATVHEALGQVGALDAAVKPLHPDMRLAGPALTVDCAPADNLAIQYAMTLARPGDVLVVDAKSFIEAGPWGDILTLYAQQIGIAGLVIDGSVRDSQSIIEMGFPVFARGVSIKGTGKRQPGTVNQPIRCGGVTVQPGAIVIGDADGAVTFPADHLARAAELSAHRTAKEDRLRGALRDGANLLDLMELRERANDLGYHDEKPPPQFVPRAKPDLRS